MVPPGAERKVLKVEPLSSTSVVETGRRSQGRGRGGFNHYYWGRDRRVQECQLALVIFLYGPGVVHELGITLRLGPGTKIDTLYWVVI